MDQIVPMKSSFVPKVLRTPSWIIVMKMEEYIPTYIPAYDDLEPWMYRPYPHVPTYYTTVLYGSTASKCRPSKKIMLPIFRSIKYGEGLNKYWRVNWWDEIKRDFVQVENGRKVGEATKKEVPNKGNHGDYISAIELIKRTKEKGMDARNARRLLKRRGYALVSGEWVLQK